MKKEMYIVFNAVYHQPVSEHATLGSAIAAVALRRQGSIFYRQDPYRIIGPDGKDWGYGRPVS